MNTNKLRYFFAISVILASITVAYGQDTLSIPGFSFQHGFYETAFDLIITSDTEEALIVYTLDGSDPKNSQTAIIDSSPMTISIDPEGESSPFMAPGVVLRAMVMKDGSVSSESISQTYLFLNKIAVLSPDEQRPGEGWPERNMENDAMQFFDYGLDPEVLNGSLSQEEVEKIFLSLPSVSLVTDLENLFDSDSGIYVNARKHGIEWERPASIELINPGNSPGFQINAGLRIRGGWGRRNENPKHAFRLFFREEYGPKELEYPLFGDEGVKRFDKIDLRTSQNYSWAAEGSDRNTLVREVLSRDIQKAMGQPYTRSRYYHLYINAVYWGIYQTQERSEASYASAYFGGARDDYDVIKVDVGENLELYEIEATDGTLDAYQRLWEMASNGFTTDEAYYKVQGQNPDGTPNPEYENLLDVDNLVDYMLCTYYVGDGDGPVNGNQKPNNFYAIYNRNNPQGFKYFRHDAEHALFSRNANLTGPVTAGEEFRYFNPRWLHQKLVVHPEYRLRFADKVYKHFFNYGACIDQASINRLIFRKNEIDLAIIAQSARWGDSRKENPRTREDDWIPAINFMKNDVFPGRTNIVVNQFKSRDWYPDFDPPQFSIASGVIDPQTMLEIYSAVGEIYYTQNGTDPRLAESISGGGNISPDASKYENPIEIDETSVVKARTLSNGEWSALNEISLTVPDGFDNLKITEIHYHPMDYENVNDRELEFIELKNMGNLSLSLDGLSFVRGIDYTFASETQIAGEEYLVLASNPLEFEKRYGFVPFGEYEGQLANNGETISLVHTNGDTLISVKYDDKYPWPNSADGDGYSLSLLESKAFENPNDPLNWHASKMMHGSPGMFDVSVAEIPKAFSSAFKLYQNYPNPFNSVTTIKFDIFQSNHVHLRIFNSMGQQVATLVDERLNEGTYSRFFDVSGLPAGIYFYQIRMDNYRKIKKMILLK